jgi:hypothetical protein
VRKGEGEEAEVDGEKRGGRRGPYEQVLEVGGGYVVLGLVGGEEAEVADHAVAAPQQVDPPADPFLPSKSERVRRRRRNSADRGMAIGEGANLAPVVGVFRGEGGREVVAAPDRGEGGRDLDLGFGGGDRFG